MRSRLHHTAALTGIAVCLAIPVACRSTDPDPSPPATTAVPATSAAPATDPPVAVTDRPATSAPATTPLSDDAAIRATIDRYWRVVLVANSPPDPSNPELASVLTGAALERAKKNIQDEYLLGQTVELPDPSRSEHRILSITLLGDSARVTECVIDDAVLKDRKTGQALNAEVKTLGFEKVLVRSGGQWLIAENRVTSSTTGVVPCAG